MAKGIFHPSRTGFSRLVDRVVWSLDFVLLYQLVPQSSGIRMTFSPGNLPILRVHDRSIMSQGIGNRIGIQPFWNQFLRR